jgi:hypothetical protein
VLKVPSDYYSKLRQPDGGQWVELMGYSHRKSTQRESWTRAVKLTELGQKAARQKNTLLHIRKSYSLFLGVTLKKGVVDVGDDDDE